MPVVETVAKIGRAFVVHGEAVKEICREFPLSRKVVRKVIRSDETASPISAARIRSPSSGRGSRSLIGFWR